MSNIERSASQVSVCNTKSAMNEDSVSDRAMYCAVSGSQKLLERQRERKGGMGSVWGSGSSAGPAVTWQLPAAAQQPASSPTNRNGARQLIQMGMRFLPLLLADKHTTVCKRELHITLGPITFGGEKNRFYSNRSISSNSEALMKLTTSGGACVLREPLIVAGT